MASVEADDEPLLKHGEHVPHLAVDDARLREALEASSNVTRINQTGRRRKPDWVRVTVLRSGRFSGRQRHSPIPTG